MRIKRLEVRNFRQHAVLDQDFGTGIIGIFGVNGAGKSNLLKALKYNVTGDYGDETSKEGNINRNIVAGEKAYVAGTWEHEGQEFELYRSLSSPKQHFIQGGTILTSVTGIQEQLERMLKMPLRMIKDFLFVDQWKIFEFLLAEKADRSKALSHLCGTADLEALWADLGERISKDQSLGVPPELDLGTERLQNLIASQQGALDSVTEQLGEAQAEILPVEELARLQQLVRDVQKQQMAAQQSQTLEARLQLAKRTLQAAEASGVPLRTRHELLSGQREQQSDQVDEYLQLLPQLEAVKTKEAKRASYLQQLSDPDPLPPTKSKSYKPKAELDAQLRTLESRLGEIRSTLDTFEQEGVVACPTCGTPVTSLDEHLEDLKVEEAEGKARQPLLRAAINAAHTYERQFREYERNLANHTAAHKSIRVRLEELGEPEVVMSEEEVTQIREYLAEFEQLDLQLTQATAAVRGWKENVHIPAETTVRTLQEQWDQLQQELEKQEMISPAEAGEAAESLQQHVSAEAVLGTLQRQQATLQQDLVDLSNKLQRAQSAQERYALGKSWLEDLEVWRGVVHRDNLPRLITESFLGDLAEKINTQLVSFGTPFLVEPGPDLTLTVCHNDGKKETSLLLSGGQKVVLAIAYRQAINPDEFLVLDEPTAGLDRNNLGCLADVLERWRVFTQQQGRQIIMVTHDERLERVFSQVIHLQAP